MRKAGIFFGQNAVNGAAIEYDGWWGFLNGCVPDARNLAIAYANMGFSTQAVFSGLDVAGPSIPQIMTLECTLARWRQAHAEFQGMCEPGDIYVFGNSGHGGQYPIAAGGVGETMCFADGQLYDSEFHNMMCRWPAGVTVIYILDTCYSGGMDRDRARRVPRVAPKWLSERNLVRPRPIMKAEDIPARILQYCASMKPETSGDGPYGGSFTSTYLAVWEQASRAGQRLTWASWYEESRKVMDTAFPDQHPVLNVLGAGAEVLNDNLPQF